MLNDIHIEGNRLNKTYTVANRLSYSRHIARRHIQSMAMISQQMLKMNREHRKMLS